MTTSGASPSTGTSGRHLRHRELDVTERLHAVQALPDGPAASARLLEAARDPSPEVARAALQRLAQVAGPAQRDALRELLFAGDSARAPDVARALVASGDNGIEALARSALRDEPYGRRLTAVLVLEAIGSTSAGPALAQATRDPAAAVRRAALGAMAAVAPSHATARAAVAALPDPAPDVRIAALRALQRVAPRWAVAAAPIAGDPVASVRRALAASTSVLASPTAERLLADDDPGVRRTAADHAGVAQRAALEHVLAHDGYEDVRRAAARRLGALDDHDAADALVAALRDRVTLVRAAALAALQELFEPEALVVRLVSELREADPDRRIAALHALARLPRAHGALPERELLDDPDVDVRLALVSVAAALASDAATLLTALAHDRNPYVRHAASVQARRPAQVE